MERRGLFAAASVALVSSVPGGPARAQTYPAGPIRAVVTSPPGGTADLVSRVVGEKLGATLHQPVVIENRPGGSTLIGTQAVARARPDGYTLLLLQPFNVIGTLLQESVPYDLLRDLTPIASVGSFPLFVTVRAGGAIRSLADLAAIARSKEGGIFYASGGIGSLGHLSAADLLATLGLPNTHVPYRGNQDAVQAILSGAVDVMLATSTDVTQLARAGSLRLLTITSESRLPALPEVPTTREVGYPDLLAKVWFGYMAPAGTPDAITGRLQDAITRAMSDATVQERLTSVGFEPAPLGREGFEGLIRSELQRWRQVIRRNNIVVN